MQILSKKCHNLFFLCIQKTDRNKNKTKFRLYTFWQNDFNQFHYKKKIIQAVY